MYIERLSPALNGVEPYIHYPVPTGQPFASPLDVEVYKRHTTESGNAGRKKGEPDPGSPDFLGIGVLLGQIPLLDEAGERLPEYEFPILLEVPDCKTNSTVRLLGTECQWMPRKSPRALSDSALAAKRVTSVLEYVRKLDAERLKEAS